ncbi:UNKNOWN [Stylonychia lemnae]|uniref:Transmembrane protein n=1 Tax=Stylonychia lemnae TaxID=5949 RepID=A0A078AQ97_STYLE|nr:UNKNOWN [Stylonychia lemnae]|eukprot:CDW84575.1 UNKNOWN [Stylonychia lemnae]
MDYHQHGKRIQQLLMSLFILKLIEVTKAIPALNKSTIAAGDINGFQQIKNLSRIIARDPEAITIQLDNYFKGQNLTYDFELLDQSTNKYIDTDQEIFQFQQPIIALNTTYFGTNSEQHSMPQSSCLFTDKEYNSYLVFVDFQMKLNIYNVSSYYFENVKQRVKQLNSVDLYNAKYEISNERQCNNLIDLKDYSNVNLTYQYSTVDYQQMKNGRIDIYQQFQNISYLVFLENVTNSEIYVYSYTDQDGFQKLFFMGWFHMIVDQDGNSRYFKQLKIKDTAKANFYDNLLFGCDFEIGLLVWNITCMSNEAKCLVSSFTYLEGNRFNKLAQFDNINLQEKVIFVQAMTPLEIYEISLPTMLGPFISKIYHLGQDLNKFIAMNVMDANNDFLIIQLIEIQTFKPLLRLYKRGTNQFSQIHSEIRYSQFLDMGVYLKFINSFENFFILKTSNFFSIYAIYNSSLVINAHDSNLLQQNNYYDKEFILRVNATNYTGSQLTTFVDLLFINNLKNKTMAIYKGSKYMGDSEPILLIYSCGSRTQFYNIDPFFGGPNNNLLIQGDNFSGGFFDIQNRQSNLNYTQINFKLKNCTMNQYIKLQDSELLILDTSNEAKKSGNFTKYVFNVDYKQILEGIIDQKNQKFMVFSRSLDDQNKYDMIVQIFDLFNVLMWESSIDLNEIFPGVMNDFEFRSFDPIQFSTTHQILGIISDPVLSTPGISKVSIAFFKTNYKNDAQFLKYLNMIKFELPWNDKVKTSILQVKFSDNIVWVLQSDLKLKLYQIYQQGQLKMDNKLALFKFKGVIDLFNQTNAADKELINFKIISNYLVCFYNPSFIYIYNFNEGLQRLYLNTILPKFQDSFKDYNYVFVINNITKKVVFENLDTYIYVLYEKHFQNQFYGFTLFVYRIDYRRYSSLLFRFDLPSDIDEIDLNILQKMECQYNFKFCQRLKQQLNQLMQKCSQIYVDMKEISRWIIKFIHQMVLKQNSKLSISNQMYAKYQFYTYFHGFDIQFKAQCGNDNPDPKTSTQQFDTIIQKLDSNQEDLIQVKILNTESKREWKKDHWVTIEDTIKFDPVTHYDYGVIIYNLKSNRITNKIPISNYVLTNSFKINHIVVQRNNNIKLIVSQQGIISILFQSENFTDLVPEIRAEYFNTNVKVQLKQGVTVGPLGKYQGYGCVYTYRKWDL